MGREYPEAILDPKKIVAGYEINTNKFFADDKNLKPSSEIVVRLRTIDNKISSLFDQMTKNNEFKFLSSEGCQSTGYDWLGDIPRDWNVEKINSLYKEVSVKNCPNEEPLSVFREYGVIKRNERDNKNVLSDDLSNYKLVEKNDLVLNKMKCWSGSLGVSEHRGIVSPSYIVLKPKKDFDHECIHFLLRSQGYINQYNRLSYGVRPGQWDLRFVDFKNLPVVLPNIHTQNMISKLLTISTNLSLEIEDLNRERDELFYELRSSQINEVSVGKIS